MGAPVRLHYARAGLFVCLLVAPAASRAQALESGETQELNVEASLSRGGPTLTVEQVVRRVLAASPELREAAAAEREAVSAVDEVSVDAAPRFELSAAYKRLSDIEAGRLPLAPDAVADAVSRRAAGIDAAEARSVPDFPQVSDQFGVRGQLSYGLTDLFLLVLPTIRSSRQLAAAQGWNARARQQAVVLRARDFYHELARAKAGWIVAQATLEDARTHARAVRIQVQAGVLDRAAELAANAGVGAAEVALTRATLQRDRAVIDLSGMLGAPLHPDTAFPPQALEPPRGLRESREALIRRALELRPELRLLRTTVDAKETEQGASASLAWPRLEVVAGVDLQRPKPRAFPQQDVLGWAWDVGAVLSWSPNDAFRGNARHDKAAAAVARARAELQSREQQVRTEVEQAVAVYLANLAALAQATANVAPAVASHVAHETLFAAGTVPSRDVLDAAGELRRARLEHLNAAVDARLARDRLRFAVGDDLLTSPEED